MFIEILVFLINCLREEKQTKENTISTKEVETNTKDQTTFYGI